MQRINFFLLLLLFFSGVLMERHKKKGFDVNFQQSDYNITSGPLILHHYNKDYLKQFQIVTFKYNRTTTAFNFTFHFIEDIGYEMEILTQAYKFASNEYREFPLRFEYNYCDGLAVNAFGTGNIHKCGNFTGCPIRKGKTIRLCNWTIDQSRFPPYIPNGQYMFELQAMYRDVELMFTRGHAEITRPIPWI